MCTHADHHGGGRAIALGAAYGTAKSGTGIAAMSVMRPELIMKSIIPVVMVRCRVRPARDPSAPARPPSRRLAHMRAHATRAGRPVSLPSTAWW